MSMFKRPTDDSSDSDISSEASSEAEEIDHSHASTEEIFGADLTTTRTLSSGESISIDRSRDEPNFNDLENVRNMMLASLMEDFYRTRAAELFNTANPGSNYHRQSPEIQPLARRLFTQAGQAMSSNGVLPASIISNEILAESARSQYLAGLDNLGLQNIKDSDLRKRRISASDNTLAVVKANPVATSVAQGAGRGVSEVMTHPASRVLDKRGGVERRESDIWHPLQDLARRTEHLSIVPHPTNEMQLSSVQMPRSHYKSSFQEMRLLGRGGFGRVYHTYNVFDKKEYAVKKIPLSVKLSQQYREKGHTELSGILREVQALAQLDHCNVVRYHATWIEDPIDPFITSVPPVFRAPFSRQKLLPDRPTFFPRTQELRRSSAKLLSYGISDNIRFEADSIEGAQGHNSNLGWSNSSYGRQRESSIADSDIFTDGMPHNIKSDKAIDDPSCYVLHVQMSMYPTTLAEYLTAAPTGTRNGSSSPYRHHCFHLVPALRILLGILCGLQYIHARGLVHRDIKPSNIFLSSYDLEAQMHLPEGCQNVGACPSCPVQQPYYVNPRIGDFGLVADLAREGGTIIGTRESSSGAVGTEYYRPPVGNGKQPVRMVDEKLDVYALGVVFIEMLWCCGTNMERVNLLKDVQKEVIPQDIMAAIVAEGYTLDIANRVEECIRGMVRNDHSARWSCSQTKEHLENILTRCHDIMRGNG